MDRTKARHLSLFMPNGRSLLQRRGQLGTYFISTISCEKIGLKIKNTTNVLYGIVEGQSGRNANLSKSVTSDFAK